MKYKIISLVLMFILVGSMFVIAASEKAVEDGNKESIIAGINKIFPSRTDPVEEPEAKKRLDGKSEREQVVLDSDTKLEVDEEGEFYFDGKPVSPAEKTKINDMARINNAFKNMIDDAITMAKINREDREERREKEEAAWRDSIGRGEGQIITIAAGHEGINIPEDGHLTREKIQNAVSCYHKPKCEGLKISDRDAGKLLEKVATHYQEKADKLFYDKDELRSGDVSFVEDFTANVQGTIYTRAEDDKWINAKGGTLTDAEIKAQADSVEEPRFKDAEKMAKEAQEQASSASNRGTIWQAMDAEGYHLLVTGKSEFGQYAGGIIQGLESLGSYRSLSNALFPDATKDGWFDAANSETLDMFSDLPAFAAQAYCEEHNQKSVKSSGQSSVFYRTRAGTYQFVGSIQAEVSPSKSFILCERNDNPEIDKEWICPGDAVCRNEQFCYENEDAKEPLEGTFHKITWRVTAPSDESFTPYVDENGVAIKFNLELYGSSGSVLVFKRLGAADDSVIELNNGNTDGGTITKYLPEEYNKVCIIFNKNHQIRGRFDDNAIPSEGICADFKPLSVGEVEYGGSNRQVSVTTSSAEVEFNI